MILVTGGTGLVGSHLISFLISKGEKVKVLLRKSSRKEDIYQAFKFYSLNIKDYENQVEWFEGDVLSLESLKNALANVSRVYHCAGFVSFTPSDKEKIYEVNVNGTKNVVRACLQAGNVKLCHVSSVAALQKSVDKTFIAEEDFIASNKEKSDYSKSKYLSELEVWKGIEQGLDAVVVNPSVIIGPGNWDKSSSRLIKQIDKGMIFYTTGITGYVDVRDVVKCMYELMNKTISGDRFVLNAENLSFKQIFDTIAESLDKPKPKIMANRLLLKIAAIVENMKWILFKTEPRVTKSTVKTALGKQFYNSDKIKDVLLFDFTPIKESIKWTCAFYKNE